MFHSSKRVSYLLVSGLIASATLAVVVSVAVAAARPIGWMRSNVSGFGDTQNNTVSALAVLGGQF